MVQSKRIDGYNGGAFMIFFNIARLGIEVMTRQPE
jgi:hypothetical protein